jgi:protein STE50
MATKEDIARIARSIIKLRDERIAQTEAQLTRLADDYRKLRQEMLPLFKQAKERSDPLPYAPSIQQSAASPDIHPPELSPPTTSSSQPELKSSLTRTFSKKLGLVGSTPKGHSPTHLPNTIHEKESSGLNPSAAATAASNQLTAGMSGGRDYPQPSPGLVPSPTSPMPYQPLAPRSYRDREYSNNDAYTTPSYEPPSSAKSANSGGKATPGYKGGDLGLPPSRDQTASAPPGAQSSSNSTLSTASTMVGRSDSTNTAPTSTSGSEAPQIEIFKSFKVTLEDPCWKVLPAALHKYNIHADWRQYALYIVYGDQERSVGLEEKPLALFKELDREGKKPMFMLRKLGNPLTASSAAVGLPAVAGAVGGGSSSAGLEREKAAVGRGPDSGGRLPPASAGGISGMGTGLSSSAASVRTMGLGTRDPPGGVI